MSDSVRVLIVDDSNLMRKLLASIVAKDTRLQVVGTAENGADALQKIEQLQPDVVTLDLNMPVMDGITTLREANQRRLSPAFLIVSSLAQKDAQITIDAINEGAVDYIPKPSQMMGMGALEGEIISKIVMCYESRKRTQDDPNRTLVQSKPSSNPGQVRPASPSAGGSNPGGVRPVARPVGGSNPGLVRAPGAAPGTPLRPAGAPTTSTPGMTRPAVPAAGGSNPGQVRPPTNPGQVRAPGASNPGQVRPPGASNPGQVRPASPPAGGSNPGQVRPPTNPGQVRSAQPPAGPPGVVRPPPSPLAAVKPAAPAPAPAGKPKLLIFGGSAGSMQLLQKLIPLIPPTFNGVAVFVLHLPAFFTSQLAVKLKEICPIPVEEAKDGMPVSLKRVYIAPGGNQNLILGKSPTGKGVAFRVIENDGTVTVCPSIDMFMRSAADVFRDACRGILISGTGKDGIEGLRRIKERLGEAYVQDKQSAVANQLVSAALETGVPKKSLQIPEIIELFQ